MKATTLLTSIIPFPPISWWQLTLGYDKVLFDVHEHYQKMSFRNRYYLSGPNGKQLMSIPLKNGRNQRQPIGQVIADPKVNWQIKHWRTIQSFYGKSPFFEFFEEDLFKLFKNDGKEINLLEWSLSGIRLIADLMGVKLKIDFTSAFQKYYTDEVLDIRLTFPQKVNHQLAIPFYNQVFQDRVGFQPDCSVLDLLFCQGRQSAEILMSKGF